MHITLWYRTVPWANCYHLQEFCWASLQKSITAGPWLYTSSPREDREGHGALTWVSSNASQSVVCTSAPTAPGLGRGSRGHRWEGDSICTAMEKSSPAEGRLASMAGLTSPNITYTTACWKPLTHCSVSKANNSLVSLVNFGGIVPWPVIGAFPGKEFYQHGWW